MAERRLVGSVGRRLGLLAVVAVAVGAFLLVRSALAPPEGFLLGLVPLDDGAAVVTFQYNGDDETQSWVARIDAGEGPVWWTELPVLARATVFSDGLSVGGGIATVRLAESDRYEMVGLSVDDGELLWRTAVRDLNESGLVLDWTTPDRLVEWHTVGSGSLWLGLDRRTGELLWQELVTEGLGVEAAIRGDALIRREGQTVTVLNLDDGGERYRGDASGGGCLVGDQAFFPRDDELYRLDLETLQESIVTQHAFPDPGGSGVETRPFHSDGCAPYRGLLIFWSSTSATLLAVDRGTGRVAWSVEVVEPAQRPFGLAAIGEWSGSGRGSLARSELPRYLLLGIDASESYESRLWVVDLETHRIVARTPSDRELNNYGLLRRGTRYFLWSYDRFVTFDGESGRFDGALRRHRLGEEVRPAHLRDDSLWFFGHSWCDLDEAWWAVLDPTTLDLRAAGNEDIVIQPAPRAVSERFVLEPVESNDWIRESAPTPAEGTGSPSSEGAGQ